MATARRSAPARPTSSASASASGNRKPGAQPGITLQGWLASTEDPIGEICAEIAAGSHIGACCEKRGLAYSTVRKWIDSDPTRSALYARAREDRADRLADEIVDIAEEADVAVKVDGEDQRLVLDATAVQRNKLRVDARKWVAAKLKPRVYGEKLDLTASVSTRDISDEALLARLQALGLQVSALPAGLVPAAAPAAPDSGDADPDA